ncbi:MAG: DUF4238 domain-containing protein [Pseudomonadota bacterium]
MSDPKRHHYLPETYLNGFGGNRGLLQCIEKPSGRTFSSPPNGTAVVGHMNTIQLPDGGRDQTTIESFFSTFETSYQSALSKIRDCVAPPEAIDVFVNFAILQRMRTPRARAQLTQVVIAADKSGLIEPQKLKFSEYEKLLLSNARAGKKGAINQLGMAISGHLSIATGIQLEKMHFLFLKNRTETPFVCSDNPVLISGVGTKPNGRTLKAVLPSFQARKVLIFPLSKKFLMYGDTDINNSLGITFVDNTKPVRRTLVKTINRMTSIHADRFIIQPKGEIDAPRSSDVKQRFENPTFAKKLYFKTQSDLLVSAVRNLRSFAI